MFCYSLFKHFGALFLSFLSTTSDCLSGQPLWSLLWGDRCLFQHNSRHTGRRMASVSPSLSSSPGWQASLFVFPDIRRHLNSPVKCSTMCQDETSCWGMRTEAPLTCFRLPTSKSTTMWLLTDVCGRSLMFVLIYVGALAAISGTSPCLVLVCTVCVSVNPYSKAINSFLW